MRKTKSIFFFFSLPIRETLQILTLNNQLRSFCCSKYFVHNRIYGVLVRKTSPFVRKQNHSTFHPFPRFLRRIFQTAIRRAKERYVEMMFQRERALSLSHIFWVRVVSFGVVVRNARWTDSNAVKIVVGV